MVPRRARFVRGNVDPPKIPFHPEDEEAFRGLDPVLQLIINEHHGNHNKMGRLRGEWVDTLPEGDRHAIREKLFTVFGMKYLGGSEA